MTQVILISVLWVVEVIELIIIDKNEYFDKVYPVIYCFIIIVWLIAAIIGVYYLVTTDTPQSRRWLPDVFLTASITAFSLGLWILLYIMAVYDNGEEVQAMSKGNVLWPKWQYLLLHELIPITAGSIWMYTYFKAR